MMATKKMKFNIKDPVWTKMKGYCHWPSRIADPSETALKSPYAEKQKTPKTNYLVYFFGSNNFAWMLEDTIQPFNEFKDTYKYKGKTKAFKQGVMQIEEYIASRGNEPSDDNVADAAIKHNDSNSDNAASPSEASDNNMTIDDSNRCNVIDEDVVARLKEKVAQKIKEKETMKKQLKEKKLSQKVSLKLKVINIHLDRFLKVSEVVSVAKSTDQINTKDWNQAVQIFNSLILPKLAKCLEYLRPISAHNLPTTSECHKCHETLLRIVENLKEAKVNNEVPKDIKTQIKRCMKGMKEQMLVKNFINLEIGDLSNAMIERKENDAES